MSEDTPSEKESKSLPKTGGRGALRRMRERADNLQESYVLLSPDEIRTIEDILEKAKDRKIGIIAHEDE